MPLGRMCARNAGRICTSDECARRCALAIAEGNPRRAASNRRLGRKSSHWIKLSRLARELHPFCACGATDDLTVDLVGGGDHRKATLADVVVRCRTCHGRHDGGRHT